MNREEFSTFVSTALEDVVQFAEEKAGQKLSRTFAFQWLGRSNPRITENIVEQIVKRVFIDEEHIYPCVDLGVGDLLEDGALLIVGNVAGYAPRPFGRNWKGREGPFVPIVGISFLNKLAGVKDSFSPDKPFSFITPDSEQGWTPYLLALCGTHEGWNRSRLCVCRTRRAVYQALGALSPARSWKESYFSCRCGCSGRESEAFARTVCEQVVQEW
jgi:hypothetical protein